MSKTILLCNLHDVIVFSIIIMVVFPFVFLFIIFLIIVFRREFKSVLFFAPKRTCHFLNLSFFVLLFFQVFKDPNSLPDLGEYINVFNEIKQRTLFEVFHYGLQSDVRVEPGWIVFNKIVSILSGNPSVLFAITGFLTLLGPYRTIKRYCPTKYIWLAVLLYFTGTYLQSLFVIRQHLAISICLLTMPLIQNRKLIKYLIVCAIAIFIHYSAAIWLPVYFFYHFRNEKTLFVVLVIFSIVVISLYRIILPYVAILIQGFAGWVVKNDDIGAKMTESLMIGSVFFASLFSLREHFFEKGEIRLFSLLLTFALVFSIAGIGYIQTGRLNMYYTRLVYIYIPILLFFIRNKSNRVLIGTALSSIFILVWFIHAFDPDVDYNGYKLLFW